MLPVSTRRTLNPITCGTCPAGVSTTVSSTKMDIAIRQMATILMSEKNHLLFIGIYFMTGYQRPENYFADDVSCSSLRFLPKNRWMPLPSSFFSSA